MHWIAPFEKDIDSAALEECFCRLNLAVHGLEGELKHGGNINSYYDDPHDATAQSNARFPRTMTNPRALKASDASIS